MASLSRAGQCSGDDFALLLRHPFPARSTVSDLATAGHPQSGFGVMATEAAFAGAVL